MAVPSTNTFAYSGVLAIGSHWLRVSATANPFDDSPHEIATSGLVELATGSVVSLGADDPYPASSYVDLDRAHPARRLCSPVRRERSGQSRSTTRYAAVAALGHWVLQGDDLQRCGQRSLRRFPAAYHPSLGPGALAYRRAGTHQIVYQDLRSGRTWTAPWPGKRSGPTAQMAARELIVSGPDADFRGYTIYETTRSG